MPIPDPDFYPSRIPDPKTATKERGQKMCVKPFLVATNFTIQNYFNYRYEVNQNQGVLLHFF